MINSVDVSATYKRSHEVPRIGQRKQTRVNGRVELLTLNKITIIRRWEFDDDNNRATYVFDTTEKWGEYFVG